MTTNPQPVTTRPAASIDHPLGQQRGQALVIVAIYCAVAAMMLGSLVLLASNHGRLSRRQTEYLKTQYIAEAGVEKAYAAIRSNYLATGNIPTTNQLNAIATSQLPTGADSPVFTNYCFVTTLGESNKISIVQTAAVQVINITSGTYSGLYASVATMAVTARASSFKQPVTITAGVERDLQIQDIPLFQFAVFYGMDLEVAPGPAMVISGRVHCAKNIYNTPVTSLTYVGNVTAQGSICTCLAPGDASNPSYVDPIYLGTVTQNAPPLNVPITPAHSILELPPSSGTDPIASIRLYNQAGLRIKVTNTGIAVTTFFDIPLVLPSGILTTNKTLYDFREAKTVSLTEIDVTQLKAKFPPINGVLYVADTRTKPETAVRLINGQVVPTGGFTVATPNPIYVLGDYNKNDNSPCAIMADAINILSANWNDANSSQALSSRIAKDTTVNAAFLAGIVPTTIATGYCGGLENFPRFHEDWSGFMFTYKGSMVALFASQTAIGTWLTASYGAPTRNWSFDVQFLNTNTDPPATPAARTVVRGAWAAVP